MEKEAIKMAPPWVQYVNALKAMFAKDPQIRVVYDDTEDTSVKLYVESSIKAEALSKLLPVEKIFGNVALKISIIPANLESENMISVFRDAFYGNEAVKDIWTSGEVYMSNPITYVIFEKEVVQYYNDDLGDAHGNRSTLYQEIANELFENHQGIFFCTDNK